MNTTHTTTGLDPKGEVGKLKTPLHLVPSITMEEAAKAHADGAGKYGPWNWRENNVIASTYIGALMRHVNAFRDGEDICPKSKVTHLGHIIANCGILLDAARQGTLVDDRPLPALKDPLPAAKPPMSPPFEGPVVGFPPAKTYRPLEPGEIIQKGDEWRFMEGEWEPVTQTIGDTYERQPCAPTHSYHCEHRRPVETSPLPSYGEIVTRSLKMKDWVRANGGNLDRSIWIIGSEIEGVIIRHHEQLGLVAATNPGSGHANEWQGIPVRIVEGRSLTLKPIDE